MNKLELYVDDKRVELFKDEEITITQSIKNIQKVETVFADYTQDFSVPASKENQKIFRHLDRGDVANSLDVRQRTSADILLNGILFKRGYVIFREAQVVDGKTISYKLYFVGGLGHLKTKIGDLKINQLDYNLAEFQDYESVKEGLSRDRSEQNSSGELEDILYSLITVDAGHYFSNDTTTPSTVDYPKNLSYAGLGSVSTGSGGLDYQSLKPSIRMDAIVRAIESKFRNQGVVFSNDFFKTTIAENPEWMNLFMLMHNKKGNIEPSEFTGLKKVRNGVNTGTSVVDWQSSVSQLSVLGNYQSSQVFDTTENIWRGIISGSSQELRAISFGIISTNLTAKYSVYIKDVSNPNAEYEELVKDAVGDKTVGLFYNVGNAESFGNQRIYSFWVETDETTNISINVTAIYKGIVFGPSTVTDSAALSVLVGNEQTLDIPKILPDIKVFDFLKGVFKLFNLVAYEDRSGVIVVQQYDKWRENKKTVDITEYVNDSRYGIDLKIPYNSLIFKYKENDYTERMFRNEPLDYVSTSEYGYFEETRGEITSSDKSFTSEIPFELMRYQRLLHSTNETLNPLPFNIESSIQMAELVDDGGDELKGQGIIYYPINSQHAGLWSVDNIALNNGEGDIESISSYNIPSNTLDLRTLASPEPYSLSFGDYYDSWTRRNVTSAGMYHNNYFDFLSPIFNTRNKSLKLELYLPSHLLINLELKDDIVFKGKKYRINTLKTNLQSGKSSIEIVGYSTSSFSKIVEGGAANAPVITLNGAETINVAYGATYTDLGATATDAEDGTIAVTDDSSNINTLNSGTQVITYNAIDSDGNSAAPVFRTVVVSLPPPPSIDVWSLLSVNQTTNVFVIDYTVSSVSVAIKKVKFFVKLQGAVDSPFDEVSSVDGGGNNTLSGTFSSAAADGQTYECYLTLNAGGVTVRSSDVTVTLT